MNETLVLNTAGLTYEWDFSSSCALNEISTFLLSNFYTLLK
jgi:hypothetical protein